jgi:deazaflavin-dependent oxidoreductase (nitroreductase family)
MPLPNRLRTINKHFTNRLVGKIAHSSWGPFSIIYHIGRCSGKHYETPITTIKTPSGFVVALTYGPEVDWYRNIKDAGRCKLLRHRQVYKIERIEPLGSETALPCFPFYAQLILRKLGVTHFIRLNFHAVRKSV